MLRIAVQSKGRLFDDTMTLLAEADIKLSTSKRTLLTQSSNFPVEVLFLRDDDIPQCVASGVADLGIVGENEFVGKENSYVVSGHPATLLGQERNRCGNPRNYRFGGDSSGHRTGRRYLRYRKLRLYAYQQ